MSNKIFQDAERLSAPRQADDVCLVSSITTALAVAGHPDPNGWQSHPKITKALQSNPSLQMMLISDYWRVFLGGSPTDTQSARFCLSAINGHPNDYLVAFIKGAIPTIVKIARGDTTQ